MGVTTGGYDTCEMAPESEPGPRGQKASFQVAAQSQLMTLEQTQVALTTDLHAASAQLGIFLQRFFGLSSPYRQAAINEAATPSSKPKNCCVADDVLFGLACAQRQVSVERVLAEGIMQMIILLQHAGVSEKPVQPGELTEQNRIMPNYFPNLVR